MYINDLVSAILLAYVLMKIFLYLEIDLNKKKG